MLNPVTNTEASKTVQARTKNRARAAPRASAPSELLLIRREQFLRLIEEYPDIGREMENRLRQSFADMVGALNAVKTRLSDF